MSVANSLIERAMKLKQGGQLSQAIEAMEQLCGMFPIVHGLVADRVVTPPDMSAHYRERLLLLPNSFHYNGHSLLYPDAISKDKQRSDVPGLPQYEDAVVMCNWNQFYNPVMFSICIHVMKELADVCLWLMGWDNVTQSAFRY